MARQYGLYHPTTNELIWRVLEIPHGHLLELETGVDSYNGLKAVWIDFIAEKGDQTRVQLVRILTGEILNPNYILANIITPRRYKLTLHGAQYLQAYGVMVNAGDTVYKEMVDIWLPNHLPVTEDYGTLRYGIRTLAHEERR